ncbi:MAG: hypothetical protein ABI461_04730 [Polyangiaceae bacterium]
MGLGDSSRGPDEVLRELLNVALRAGIQVRSEPLDPDLFERSRGGICRIEGVRTIVVDSSAPIEERIAVLLRALATVELDAVYMRPELRERIDRQKPVDQVKRA